MIGFVDVRIGGMVIRVVRLTIHPNVKGTMNLLNFLLRRIICYPILLVGFVLNMISGALILFSAWGLDREDVIKQLKGDENG